MSHGVREQVKFSSMACLNQGCSRMAQAGTLSLGSYASRDVITDSETW